MSEQQSLPPLRPREASAQQLEPSHLPLEQVIGPLVTKNLGHTEERSAVATLETPLLEKNVAEKIEGVVRRTRNGLVRVRVFSRPNTIIAVTLIALIAVTAYTMIAMDYGKVNFGEAALRALNDFFKMMLQPSLEPHLTVSRLFFGILITLALSVLTTFIGAVIAFVLGLLASANLSNKAVSNAIKAAMSFFRAVPTILWVLIFTVAIGLGAEAAICGLLFHSVAYLTKAYSERFEEVDRAVIEALRAAGASWWQVVFQAVVPQTLSEILSWTFIRFEINFVNAVAVGAVAGVGGIGFELSQAGMLYHNIFEVGAIVYACLVVAIILEVLATQLRKRYIR